MNKGQHIPNSALKSEKRGPRGVQDLKLPELEGPCVLQRKETPCRLIENAFMSLRQLMSVNLFFAKLRISSTTHNIYTISFNIDNSNNNHKITYIALKKIERRCVPL